MTKISAQYAFCSTCGHSGFLTHPQKALQVSLQDLAADHGHVLSLGERKITVETSGIFTLKIDDTTGEIAVSGMGRNQHVCAPFQGDPLLTKQEAEVRSQQVSDVDYTLHFHLSQEEDCPFTGEAKATFSVSPQAPHLSDWIFLDFSGGGSIQSLRVNGEEVDFLYDQAKIHIPVSEFRVGERNEISIEFTHPFSRDSHSGYGLNLFKDPKDEKSYVYSHCFPYCASQIFPLFDQPDLKATYTLTVDAPSSWEVISNALQEQVVERGDQERRWVFPTTQRFSSYAFALMAGPYHKWEAATESGIPLRLFTRQSIAEKLNAPHWFRVTQQGFQFFERAFGIPYPFEELGKYDQVCVPPGIPFGMENVGAVASTEYILLRTRGDPLRIEYCIAVALHELSHMWFGNGVTLKWWEDLWLSEGLGCFFGYLALSQMPDIIPAGVDPWRQFNIRHKERGYEGDDLITSRPVAGEMQNTSQALDTVLNGAIPYGKGSAVFKQLYYFLGEKVFFDALRKYAQAFLFKNATRDDFFRVLSEVSGLNLIAWQNEWFKSKGTNSVEVKLETREGKIESLLLKQHPDEADHLLRTHRTQVGLYYLEQEQLVLWHTLDATYSGEETLLVGAQGLDAPDFVFPNVNDFDFVKVVLDERSLLTLETSLGKISDPFARQMLWGTLWDMISHARLPAQRFIRMALVHLKEEKDLAILENGISSLISARHHLDPDKSFEYKAKIEQHLWERLKEVEQGTPIQQSLFENAVNLAQTPENLRTLEEWLEKGETIHGARLHQENRWQIIETLAWHNVPEVRTLIAAERAKDGSDEGIAKAMEAEVAIPDEENKRHWWKRILNEDPRFEPLSLEKGMRVMGSFLFFRDIELTRFATDLFFETIERMMADPAAFSDEYLGYFVYYMYPLDCSEALDLRTTEFLEKHPQLPVSAHRTLLENQQRYRRIRLARALSKQSD